MLRVHSVLPEATELLMEKLVNCAFEVHRRLGPGYLERIYGIAYGIELTLNGVPFERERAVSVRYRDRDIQGQRVDFIADGQVAEPEVMAEIAFADEVLRRASHRQAETRSPAA